MEPRNIAPTDGGKKLCNNRGALGIQQRYIPTYIKATKLDGRELVLMEAHVIVTPEQTNHTARRVS